MLNIIRPSLALTIEGENLKEEITVPLNQFSARFILVRADQISADYVINVRDKVNHYPVKRVNFPSRKGLDELLIVDRQNCQSCEVSISAYQKIDQSSKYKIKFEEFGDIDKADHLVKIYEFITEAGVWRDRSRESTDTYFRKKTLSNSILFLESASELALKFNRPMIRHHVLTLKAESEYRLGQVEEQKKTLQTILDESTQNDSKYTALAYFEMSPLTGNIKLMAELSKKGMEIGQKIASPWIEAKGANFTGKFLVSGGSPKEGKDLLLKSKKAFTKLKNWREVSIPLHNLSWVEQRLGNYPEAINYASDQLDHAIKYNDLEAQAWAYYNFGLAYNENGEIFKADQSMERAFQILSKIPFRSNSSLSNLKGAIEEFKYLGALSFGDYFLAKNYLRTVKKMFISQGWPDLVANLSYHEGQLELKSKNYDLAEKIFLDLLKYNQINGRQRSKVRTLQKLTELELSRKNILLAHEYVQSSIEAAMKVDDKKIMTRSLLSSIEALYLSKAYDEADYIADRANEIISSNASDVEMISFKYHRAIIKKELGELMKAKYFIDLAKLNVSDALAKVKRKDLRQNFLSLQKKIYEYSIELSVQINQNSIFNRISEAEEFKARTLIEKIDNHLLSKEINKSYQSNKYGIHKKIIENTISLHKKIKNQEEVLLSSRELYGELSRLEANVLKQKNNKRPTLKYSNKLSFNNIGKNELVAYYFLGDKNSWLWLITSESIEEYNLPNKHKLSPLISRFKKLIATDPASRSESYNQQLATIKDLSRILIGPMVSQISNYNKHHLTIIPDGNLNGVPFSALKNPHTQQYLNDRFTISYSQSLSLRDKILQRRSTPYTSKYDRIFAMANPVSNESSDISFAKLPFSVNEVTYIQRLFGDQGTFLSGGAASKKSVLNEVTKEYDILHFATHGILNLDEPVLSGLLFSSNDKQIGIWIQPEISSSIINAELVVLSACETSIGKTKEGEGDLSLSRAFIEAGANRVIGSLWNVEDKATSELMKKFYDNLINKKMSIAKSLQQAKKIIFTDRDKDWSDPYYWAGFQLQGGKETL